MDRHQGATPVSACDRPSMFGRATVVVADLQSTRTIRTCTPSVRSAGFTAPSPCQERHHRPPHGAVSVSPAVKKPCKAPCATSLCIQALYSTLTTPRTSQPLRSARPRLRHRDMSCTTVKHARGGQAIGARTLLQRLRHAISTKKSSTAQVPGTRMSTDHPACKWKRDGRQGQTA